MYKNTTQILFQTFTTTECITFKYNALAIKNIEFSDLGIED